MTTTPPPKRRGRPPLPTGAGKIAAINWRTTDARKARAQALADAAGLTLSAWLDLRVDKAK